MVLWSPQGLLYYIQHNRYDEKIDGYAFMLHAIYAVKTTVSFPLPITQRHLIYSFIPYSIVRFKRVTVIDSLCPPVLSKYVQDIRMFSVENKSKLNRSFDWLNTRKYAKKTVYF